MLWQSLESPAMRPPRPPSDETLGRLVFTEHWDRPAEPPGWDSARAWQGESATCSGNGLSPDTCTASGSSTYASGASRPTATVSFPLSPSLCHMRSRWILWSRHLNVGGRQRLPRAD
eukprot:2493104-Pyramimonas_sp.AAC.1